VVALFALSVLSVGLSVLPAHLRGADRTYVRASTAGGHDQPGNFVIMAIMLGMVALFPITFSSTSGGSVSLTPTSAAQHDSRSSSRERRPGKSGR